MLNKFNKTIHNKYSRFFKFIFFLRYLFAIFFLSITLFLSIPNFFNFEKRAIFIKDHIKNARVSRISYGIPIGGELECVDGTTIARAIEGRIEINVD